jgi:hypothetical protein
MRSGWDRDAHWAFFDVGPLGMAHQHVDKLHLSVTAYGRDLLVDSGIGTYHPTPERAYLVSSFAHNTIIVDGNPQNSFPKAATHPMKGNYAVTPEYDYVRGTFDNGYVNVEGKAVHTRVVVYLRGRYWVVADRIRTDRPRSIQTIWHYHPDCTVAIDGFSVVSTDQGRGNLRIVPISKPNWHLNVVKGQTSPTFQGWYSEKYGSLVPNSTAIYSAEIDRTATFVWLLVPARGSVPPAKGRIISIEDSAIVLKIELPDASPLLMHIPLTGKPVVSLKSL